MMRASPDTPRSDSAPSRRYWSRRLIRHVILGAAGLLASALVATVARDKPSFAFRWSMGTGYVGLAFLLSTLALGPIRLAMGRRSPPSTDLRRDVGIWSAVFAIAHAIIGLGVHMGGAFWKYFVDPARAPGTIVPRLDGFGIANWAGLVAVVVYLVLVLVSNDIAVRRLGLARWKSIQRWSYVAAFLVALHGAAYVKMDHRSAVFAVVFVFLTLLMGGVQLFGVREFRRVRRSAGTGSRSAG